MPLGRFETVAASDENSFALYDLFWAVLGFSLRLRLAFCHINASKSRHITRLVAVSVCD